ncbi:MAG TPA: hypothetical protein PLW48_10130 [Alphaproteobacteria bacterium]|nr:hypothetical protein [Rhodospirillaceae bacterium]HRJ67483.1 hypothetical protein [Alphaproteobacteria bacterium]
MSMLNLNFEPPGPVGDAFMQSMAPVNAIMGPVGSAKTSCLVMKTIQLAARQPRSKLDGVRYTKALFVRETFRQLYGTTIPSWWKWVPKKIGKWTGGLNQPGFHHIRFQLADASIVDLQAEFEALGEQNVEELFKGKEFNLLNLNEGDTLSPDVLDNGVIRVAQGRYPGGAHVDPEMCIKQVNIDYNAPDVENYLYKLKEENKPEGYAFFRQPGGLDPNAENRKHATREGYEGMRRQLLARGRDDLVRRNIDNEYGFTRDGKPVYAEYRDSFHCAGEELEPVRGITVFVDFDQGLRPAAVLRQTMPNGQLRVLDELYSETGSKGLAAALKKLAGSKKYTGVRIVGGKCDPAGASPNGDEEESWIDKMNRLMGWAGRDRITAAATNSIEVRLDAVRVKFKTSVDDGQPGILISSSCSVLRKGLAAHYKFKRKKGTEEHEDVPVKKFPISDVQDALQYGALDEGGYEEAVGRARRARPVTGGGMRVAKVNVKV